MLRQLQRKSLQLVIWLTALTLLPASGHAADNGVTPADNGKKRPKICLVLSGGGARGAAHVGVLKVLEEYRVPIDCIAGTSMGALVGAAFATGMSLEEMEEVNATISTALLFKEKPPRQQQTMRRKQDDYKNFFGPEFGFSDGSLSFGKGLITGVQLETVLRRLTKVRGYHNFDTLPIPYRAVATDLVTGKAVVFKEGEMANVMRASMSVPGAVAPAEFDGMILVDGMLTENLPVETARKMGADIIIAVNVGTPLLKREQLNGIMGVTGQMLSILTEQNVQASLAKLAPTDILITPELGEYSTGDFDHLPKISPRGETAARQVADQLSKLSLPPAEYAALRQRQQVAVAADTGRVDEIRFDNLKRVNPAAAKAVMRTEEGEPLDQGRLDSDMRRLYGTGDFEHVKYRFIEEPGKRILAVEAVEKSWGPDYVRFGMGLSSDLNGDSSFGVLGSYRRTWLNSLGAEWRTDVQFGQTGFVTSEFYQPLNAEGDVFIAPNVNLQRSMQFVYRGDNRVARYNTTTVQAGFDVGLNLKRYGEWRVGIIRGQVDPKLDTGPTIFAPRESNFQQGAFTTVLKLDQLDSANFPRYGWRASAHLLNSTGMLGADHAYTKWDIDAIGAYSFGEHTLNFGIKAGDTVGNNRLPSFDQFQWGGFMRQSGYATGQFLGQDLRFARLIYYRRIMEGSLFEGAYGGMSLELGKVGQPTIPGNNAGWLKSGSIFVAADSPIGPVYLGYGRNAEGGSSLYFYLGKPF